MKHLELVTTGGTIGSIFAQDSLSVDPSERRIALEVQKAKRRLGYTVNVTSALNLNSEDFCPGDWAAVLAAVDAAHEKSPDGVVVTHGTDTLAYTASALSCFEQRWPSKTILTGAYNPPDHSSSDTSINLLAALQFAAADHPANGTFVAFRSSASNNRAQILRAAQLKPMQFDDVYFLGSYGESVAIFSPNEGLVVDTSLSHPRMPALNAVKTLPDAHAIRSASNRVALLKVYPGIDPMLLAAASESRDVVVVEMYHSGTGPTADGPNSIVQVIETLSKSKTVLMGTVPSRFIPTPYESTRKLVRAGALVVRDIQPHYLFTLSVLNFSCGNDRDQLAQTLRPWLMS